MHKELTLLCCDPATCYFYQYIWKLPWCMAFFCPAAINILWNCHHNGTWKQTKSLICGSIINYLSFPLRWELCFTSHTTHTYFFLESIYFLFHSKSIQGLNLTFQMPINEITFRNFSYSSGSWKCLLNGSHCQMGSTPGLASYWLFELNPPMDLTFLWLTW